MAAASLLLTWCCMCAPLAAQDASPVTAAIHGRITTRMGAVVLAGVTVTLLSASGGREIGAAVSDAQGTFRLAGIPPGIYRIRASLAGFDAVTRADVVLAGRDDARVDLDIPLALSTHTEAVASRTDSTIITGSSQSTIDGRLIDIAPVKGDDYQALLPMLPGVLRGADGRINMKGGRPTQTGLQIGQAYANDPATGDAVISLPVDAVASIDVFPNPYTSEYGRFSAGVTRIETRKGGDTWSATANNFIPAPCLTLCDGVNWGIRSFDPRVIVAGPLVARRVFLAQSVQLHDHKDRVPSLPSDVDDTSVRSVDSFTRIDTTEGRHALTGSVALFAQHLSFVGLNTFHPQPVAPDLRRRGSGVSLFDTWRFSGTTFLESTVSHTRYDTDIAGRTPGVMTVSPEGYQGAFFNQQSRHSQTTQWTEALSVVRSGAGDHLIKIGADALRSIFAGTSASDPVEVRREDGTLSQRLVFSGPAAQHVEAIDIGVFAQDRWRVSDRLILELGARFDRDGVTGVARTSPRFGFVVGVLPGGRGIVRGGAGRFSGRTPLLAARFDHLEAPAIQRFALDGSTPNGAPVAFTNRIAPGLQPSLGRVWNVEYDHRLTKDLALKVNHLERDGQHELVIDPVESGLSSALTLSSDGRSRYRETEVTLQYSGASDREFRLSYVRSRSEGDLNAFDDYFGNVRNPIIRANSYGPTSVDVPNRLIAFAVLPVRRWMVSPLLEVRNGFPFSVVNDDQDFVGPRDASGRFPLFWTADLTVNRALVVRGRRLRVGLRTNHLFNNATPRDVQANVASPAFGAFFNPLVRSIGLTVEIRP